MRALALSLLLVLPAMVGCLAAQTGTEGISPSRVLVDSVEVPAGAEVVEDPLGVILRFADVELPFETEIAVPDGATIVRAIGKVGDDVRVSATMWNTDTGRRRCNTDAVDLWDLPITGVSQCSGLAAIDPPGATWTVRVTGGAAQEDPVTGEVTAPALGTVDVLFESTPLDGLAGQLDLTQLSMPTHELQDTQYLTVPSFDGTPLWVEVTLPVGEGPWPTVIASSPYNTQYGRGEVPAMWTYFTQDWAKRGYAVVNADVRGFGMSGGCVEVWSENEQKDQAFLVDWVAEQAWSDGNVGFYGQSYVGTTPVAAAVQAPEALKAIIAVAPVINAYWDWHFGGVPNGESTGSPVAYQVLTDAPLGGPADPTDPMQFALGRVSQLCDPTLVARANDPRAIYDAFYEERNFTLRAADVKAAVLYTQGFEDSNVKSAMIPGWFNEITAPKLGIFGHWVHQHPTRADEEIMFLGWMDQYVKGRALGFDKAANAEIVVDDETFRTADAWPPTDAIEVALAADALVGDIVLAPVGGTPFLASAIPVATLEVANDTAAAGVIRLAVSGALLPAGNAHFYAEIHDVSPEGERGLVTYGGFNLAHRDGHDQWTPSAPMETTSFELPFVPTEYVFRAGHTIEVTLVGVASDTLAPESTSPPGVYRVDAATLLLPTIPMALYAATPATALR